MKNCIQTLVTAVIILGTALFTCVDIPTDPALNPSNSKVHLFIKDGSDPVANAGTSKAVGLELTYLQHLKSIRVISTCGNLDTSFIVDTTKYTDLLYFNPLFSQAGECYVIATATMQNSELKDRIDTLTVHVLTPSNGISFIKSPESKVMVAGNKDTLVFVSLASTGVITPLSYQLTVTPSAGIPYFTPEYSALKDTVRVIAAPLTPDAFTIALSAFSMLQGAPVSATVTVGILVKSNITPSLVHAPEQIAAGKPDTLRFAVDNSTRPDPLTIKLVTDKPLDPSVFTILPSGADSIIIAIAPTAQPSVKPTTIGIITSNGTSSDTSFFPVSLVNSEQIPADNTAPTIVLLSGPKNGERVKTAAGTVSLTISDASGIDSALWTLNGVAAGLLQKQPDGTFQTAYTLSTFGENIITIIATDKSPKHNKSTLPVKLVYNTVPSAVIISLPATNATAVSTAPTFIWTGGNDADADIVTSKVIYGETATALSLSTSEVTVQTVALPLTAPLAANKSYFWQVISYTKMPYADTVVSAVASFTTAGTGITITTQPVAPTALYTGDPLTLTVAAAGTPEPTCQWYKDNTPLPGSTSATFTKASVTSADNGVYYAVLKNGTGADVTTTPVTITVKTKVSITADPEPLTVSEGAGATFTVAAAGDPVLSYQWQAGTEKLSGQTAATLTIPKATPADGGKSYSCVVSNGFSSATSKAALLTVSATPVYVVKFDTDAGSIINDASVKQGELVQKPSTDPKKDGYKFKGWFISGTSTTAFDFSKTITGATTVFAQWDKIYKITYNENYATTQDVPVDTGKYKTGDQATVLAKPANLRKDGSSFTGWCEDINGTASKVYVANEKVTIASKDIVLFAQWKRTQYTIKLDPRGGTVSATTVQVALTANASVLPIPTKSGGYFFLGWFDAPTNGTKITSFTKDQTLYAQYEAIECSARGNDVYICSGDGKTYNFSVYSNNSECSIVKYGWYTVNYAYHYLPDPEFESLTLSGQGTNTLSVGNITGGAYGFVCIVTFEGGALDTVGNWSPDPSCNPQQ